MPGDSTQVLTAAEVGKQTGLHAGSPDWGSGVALNAGSCFSTLVRSCTGFSTLVYVAAVWATASAALMCCPGSVRAQSVALRQVPSEASPSKPDPACQNDASPKFCKPDVPGMPRPKAFEVSWENVFRYGMQSQAVSPRVADAVGAGYNVVNREERLALKLKVPVYISQSWKVVLGFNYANEDYVFSDLRDPDYALHRGLHDHNLKRIGAAAYVSKSWRGNRYFAFRLGADLNGDYGAVDRLPLVNYLSVTAAPMLGWKIGEEIFLGGGVAYNHTLGKPGVLPFLVYNHTFNDKWGIETVLPARARVRWNIDRSSLLYAGFRIDGASYAIHAEVPELGDSESFRLRSSEFRLSSTFEREIHDFLWFELEAGMRADLRFDLASGGGRNAEVLIDSQRKTAPFLRAGIFLVPPSAG